MGQGIVAGTPRDVFKLVWGAEGNKLIDPMVDNGERVEELNEQTMVVKEHRFFCQEENSRCGKKAES